MAKGAAKPWPTQTMTASHAGGIPGGMEAAGPLLPPMAAINGSGCSATAAPDVARCLSGMHGYWTSPGPRQHTALCAPSATAEASLPGSAAAAPLQQTAGCCRNGTRTIRTQPQSLRPAVYRSTNGDAQQAGAMQIMRPRQTIAVRRALDALLAGQRIMGRSAMAAWQSSDLT